MKRIWRKFKNWLIIKLGGHIVETVKVEKYFVPTAVLESYITVDKRNKEEFNEAFIAAHLAKYLSTSLIPHMEIDHSDSVSFHGDTRTYRARIRIVENYSKGETR